MKKALIALLLLLAPALVFGQGGMLASDGVSSTAWVYGQKVLIAIPGASITVCSIPVTLVNGACTNKVAIYSDFGLTQTIANPTTLDTNSNYSFYAASTVLQYTVTLKGVSSGPFFVRTPGQGSGGTGTGTTLPPYTQFFTGQTTVTVPGSVHGYRTMGLITACYDSASPAHKVEPAQLYVNTLTYDVTVLFASPQSGVCVVNGGTGAKGDIGSAGPACATGSGTCNMTVPIVAPGFSSLNYPVTDIRSMGAKCDGINPDGSVNTTPTDDSVALQATINYAISHGHSIGGSGACVHSQQLLMNSGSTSVVIVGPTNQGVGGLNFTFSQGTAPITAISESGTTATVVSTSNPTVGSTVIVAGVTPLNYNGAYSVLTSSVSNFTFSMALGAGTAFGTASIIGTTAPVTAISEVGNTVTVASTLSPATGSTVTLAGITPTNYNGSFPVLTSSATSFTFSMALTAGTNFGIAAVPGTTSGWLWKNDVGNKYIYTPVLKGVSFACNNPSGCPIGLEGYVLSEGVFRDVAIVSINGGTKGFFHTSWYCNRCNILDIDHLMLNGQTPTQVPTIGLDFVNTAAITVHGASDLWYFPGATMRFSGPMSAIHIENNWFESDDIGVLVDDSISPVSIEDFRIQGNKFLFNGMGGVAPSGGAYANQVMVKFNNAGTNKMYGVGIHVSRNSASIASYLGLASTPYPIVINYSPTTSSLSFLRMSVDDNYMTGGATLLGMVNVVNGVWAFRTSLQFGSNTVLGSGAANVQNQFAGIANVASVRRYNNSVQVGPNASPVINHTFDVHDNSAAGVTGLGIQAGAGQAFLPLIQVFNATGGVMSSMDYQGKWYTSGSWLINPLGGQRWQALPQNAETGSNSGSDYALVSYDDTGAYLRTAFSINRATGIADVLGMSVTGVPGITASGTSCVITAILGGIITGAHCP